MFRILAWEKADVIVGASIDSWSIPFGFGKAGRSFSLQILCFYLEVDVDHWRFGGGPKYTGGMK